jgi:hypothetical protein
MDKDSDPSPAVTALLLCLSVGITTGLLAVGGSAIKKVEPVYMQ